MGRQWFMVFVCLVTSIAAQEKPATTLPASPHWIMVRSGGSGTLSEQFSADQPIQQATLQFAADFCTATVTLNDTAVLRVAPYCQSQTLDITNALQRGPNTIRVLCEQASDLSAIALSLDIRFVDGSSIRKVSDAHWTASGQAASALNDEASPPPAQLVDRGEVASELWGIGRREISLSAYENYEQWQQSKGEVADKNRPKFWLAPGFEITELRVAQPDEGSWIAMAFDEQGRLTVSREDVGLLRMTITADRKSVMKVEPIRVDLQECRGLAYRPWTLFANANNSKALFKLHLFDTGEAGEVEKLREFPGGVGHGRNDIALHGDLVYSIHGDSVDLPSSDFVDHTSPLRESRMLSPKKEGTLWRVNDSDQPTWELLHAGLRNPYGIDVDERGEPFTFDADNEHDMGTPWYRPTRILHLIQGGDSGYREVTGQLPPRFHDQPDHAPPLFDIGRSSPTSVMFGSRLEFPAPYRRSLFALDWTYGRVLAVHLFPRGMTYRTSAETFLQGRPFNVTDVAAGPDGAMYLITGGRKTQSALYRIAYTGGLNSSEPAEHSAHETACATTVATAQLQDNARRDSTPDVEPLIRFPDPVRRHRDRTDLETSLAGATAKEARSSLNRDWKRDLSPMDYLLARARQRDVSVLKETLLPGLLKTSMADLDLTSQFLWVRCLGLALETAREDVLSHRDQLIPHVVAVWKALDSQPLSVAPEGTSLELRRRLAYLLGDLGAAELPALAGSILLASEVQEDQIAGLLALRNQTTGWSTELRRQQFATMNAISRMIGGAGLPPLEKWLREESLKTLTEAEKVSVADLLIPQPIEAEPLPPARPLVRKWRLDDLADLHTGNGIPGDAERGRLLFREALCARCHRVGLRGAAVGPDLTHVGRRFSRRDMLESVLTPSLSVAENYRMETITTYAGQVYTGRIIPEGDYRSEKVRLSLDALDASKLVEIDKKEITEHTMANASPMPSGLLDTLSVEQIADLLAFLESGGAGR